MRWIFPLLVGLSVSLGDVVFHYLFVFPFESAGYFVAKFAFAFIVAAAMQKWKFFSFRASVVGALIFTSIMSAWYYLAYLLYDPEISSCVVPPTYNCAIPDIPQTVLFYIGGYPATYVSIIEASVHAILFFVAYLVWSRVK